MALDPKDEFETPEPIETPDDKGGKGEPKEPSVSAAEVADLRDTVGALKAELGSLRSDSAIVAKLKEALGAPSAADPKDAFIRKEIMRLMPELADVARIKEVLPVLVDTLGTAAEERVYERAATAQEATKEFMKSDGLNPDDKEAFEMLEDALSAEIKRNPELLRMWSRGNVRGAVSKAYDKVSTKILAPVRTHTKRSAVQVVTGSPKAGPRGGSPSPSPAGKSKIDFNDTSPAGKKAIHEAAFDRLLELQGE